MEGVSVTVAQIEIKTGNWNGYKIEAQVDSEGNAVPAVYGYSISAELVPLKLEDGIYQRISGKELNLLVDMFGFPTSLSQVIQLPCAEYEGSPDIPTVGSAIMQTLSTLATPIFREFIGKTFSATVA